MVTLSFTIFSGQKNYNRAHMLFQVLCGFEPIFYTTHPNEESLNFLLYNLSLLTLGFLFHHPIAVTIYIIITGSLRAITGGYHCKTRISCYILSYTIFCIYLLTIATIPMISAYVLIPIYIICWILILVVSPVDTPNKVFSQSAKKTARKKTYIIFFFNSIFTILSLLLHWNKDLIFIDLSLIICATGLYTGYISNIRRYHES